MGAVVVRDTSTTHTLTVDAVSKSFSGVSALENVSLRVSTREILGVIGPNGSGKTTLINVISGMIRPSGGTVTLDGRRLSTYRSDRVARAGIARTFQSVRLFPDLTIFENMMVTATSSPRNRRTRDAVAASYKALESLNLGSYARAQVDDVPYPIQRRVEIARAVTSKPSMVLLDEPAAGLNEHDSDSLVKSLVSLCESVPCGILLVDHNLRLMMGAAHRIHVLSEGNTLMEGTPTEVRTDDRVVSAYLGSAASRLAKSGGRNDRATG